MYCQVIVDIVHENVARPFTYAIPAGMKLSEGQRVLVPFGPGKKEGIVVSLSCETDLDAGRIRAVLSTPEDYPVVLSPLMELAKEMAEQAHCPLAETLRLMLPPEMRRGRIHPKTEETVSLLVSAETADALALREKRSEKRKQLLQILRDGQERTVSQLEAAVPNCRPILKKMALDQQIQMNRKEKLRIPEECFQADETQWHALTPEQEEVLEEIEPAMRTGRGRFLLHGVTGSGKTEVFMHAVRQTLSMGKSAIIMVPEIALTPQMVRWFRERFGPVAAVMHSGLSAGERYDEWRRIRMGIARVVIGARSAVFAPTQELGLIVVDEEHESTYLNDHHPRYDARNVAASRCSRERATLLLASATPSILSFARARRGDYMLLEMPNRVQNRPLPEVRMADMRRELEDGNRSVLSRQLQSELTACIRQNGQAMLLMNRRGYHSFVSCRSCGYVVKCPNCDVSMTYHMGDQEGKLKCHYCGATMDLPSKCPACGSPYIKFFGAGTQKVEEEVHRLLPGVSTVRMDIDTTSGKNGHGRLLEEFRSGRARILIGTQMIAKGLDFPRVTLVGVIAADLTLNLPDYRSRERTFQLLTQVAGRAGRGVRPGTVILQTYKPEDPVLRLAARQDYRSFFEEEFRRRRESLYPPFTVIARLLVEGTDEEDVNRVASRLESAVRLALEQRQDWKKKVLLMTNDVPGVKMLRGRYRRHLLFKLLTGAEAEEFCRELADMADNADKQTDVCFEYNPVSLM